MKKLNLDEAGAGHIILIVVFVVALAGIIGFAYTRISDKQDQQEVSTSQEDEANDNAEDNNEDIDSANEDDPTAGLDEPAAN